MLFGLFVALATANQGKPGRSLRPFIYALASGLIYVLAGVTMAYGTLILTGGIKALPGVGFFGILLILFALPAISGFLGAFLLHLAAILVLRDFRGPARLDRILLTTVIGGLSGVAFFLVCMVGGTPLVPWMLAFAVWQVPVGLALATTLRPPASP